MEEQLKNLRRVLDKTAFSNLNFTDQHRKNIKERINKQNESDENVLFAVMQLLVHEKTGYELAKNLRRRGIQKFEDAEGFLYILLHRLEQKGYLQSVWDESKVKHYRLNDKGKRILQKAENKRTKKQLVLKELLQE
ncbi:MAG: PadR family transcriptional regulator [Heyndrickxia sp.]